MRMANQCIGLSAAIGVYNIGNQWPLQTSGRYVAAASTNPDPKPKFLLHKQCDVRNRKLEGKYSLESIQIPAKAKFAPLLNPYHT